MRWGITHLGFGVTGPKTWHKTCGMKEENKQNNATKQTGLFADRHSKIESYQQRLRNYKFYNLYTIGRCHKTYFKYCFDYIAIIQPDIHYKYPLDLRLQYK